MAFAKEWPGRGPAKIWTAECPLRVGAHRTAPEGSSTAQPRARRRSRSVREWPRAPLGARRCWLNRSAAVGAASRSSAETDGLRPGRLARKCCATCLLTKPTIAGRCVCSRINSDSRCRTRWRGGCGIAKSCGKNAGRPAAPAAILKEPLPALVLLLDRSWLILDHYR